MGSPSNSSSYPASTISEKDLEASTLAAIVPTRSRYHEDIGYDEAIVRVTSSEPDDPEKKRYEVYEHSTSMRPTRTVSNTRSTKDLEAVLGTQFEVRWTENDPECPLNFSWTKKGLILFLVSMQTLVVYVVSLEYPGLFHHSNSSGGQHPELDCIRFRRKGHDGGVWDQGQDYHHSRYDDISTRSGMRSDAIGSHERAVWTPPGIHHLAGAVFSLCDTSLRG